MKTFWLVSLSSLFAPAVYSASDSMLNEKGVETAFVASPYQSEISFQSDRLPAWKFGVRYNRQMLFHDQWVDQISSYQSVDSVRISASRVILKNSTQRIFAALQTSNDEQSAFVDWLYVPSNAGTAASVGWQIGELNSVQMAVELRYREVSDKDVSSLLLGVQYYF